MIYVKNIQRSFENLSITIQVTNSHPLSQDFPELYIHLHIFRRKSFSQDVRHSHLLEKMKNHFDSVFAKQGFADVYAHLL